MKKKPITAVLLDAEKAIAKKVTFEPTLENYYKMLNCQTIDMPVRSIDGKPVRIVCDDEGALKSSPIISAVDGKMEPMLVGSLLFIGDDGSPEECSLPDDMCDWILNHIKDAICRKPLRAIKVLTKCEYC